MKIPKLEVIAEWLVLIGAINWGLLLLNANLVEMLLGGFPGLVSIVYGSVGVSAIYLIAKKVKLIK